MLTFSGKSLSNKKSYFGVFGFPRAATLDFFAFEPLVSSL